MIKQAAKAVANNAAIETQSENYSENVPFGGGHYAIERNEYSKTNEIQLHQESLPTCPSSCRCECPQINAVDKIGKLPPANHVVPNTVGNATTNSKEL